jgi:hypothetical protein
MLRKLLAVSAVLAWTSTPALAQRVEASANVGWTFSDGVSFSGIPVNGGIYTRADPKDSVSYSLSFGVFVTHQVEVEFLWNHQPTKLEVTGTAPTLTTNMHVDNYHGNIVFNGHELHSHIRPFFYFGLGATNYGDAVFPSVTVQGLTRFSWAAGAGIKAYPSPHVGFRAAVRWVPTWIKTDQVGWWCDPFWGCVPAGNTQYSNQFELSGGVTVRFGGSEPEPQPEPLPAPEPQPFFDRR